MDDRGGEPILQWFPICKCHLPATGCQYCCTLFGGFQFQATFLIRNHSNVHCVEVGSKAALKDDETFDVYHLDKCTMFRNHSNVHCVEVDLKAALN